MMQVALSRRIGAFAATALSIVAGTTLLTAFVPARRVNPPLIAADAIDSHLPVPPRMQAILQKACNDCHSNGTHWPWYANLPVVSDLLEKDVARARAALNFSEWSQHAGRSAGLATGVLMAACQDVKTGRMPPQQYRMVHPDAKLTAEESGSLCAWTVASVKEVKAGRAYATSGSHGPSE